MHVAGYDTQMGAISHAILSLSAAQEAVGK